jgi:hypothetical protein
MGAEVLHSRFSAARKLSPKRQNPTKSIPIRMKFGREVKIHVRKIIPKFDNQTTNRTP